MWIKLSDGSLLNTNKVFSFSLSKNAADGSYALKATIAFDGQSIQQNIYIGPKDICTNLRETILQKLAQNTTTLDLARVIAAEDQPIDYWEQQDMEDTKATEES